MKNIVLFGMVIFIYGCSNRSSIDKQEDKFCGYYSIFYESMMPKEFARTTITKNEDHYTLSLDDFNGYKFIKLNSNTLVDGENILGKLYYVYSSEFNEEMIIANFYSVTFILFKQKQRL